MLGKVILWVSAAALNCLDTEAASKYQLAFKGPVFTKSKVLIEKAENKQDFNLFTEGNERPVILGKIS